MKNTLHPNWITGFTDAEGCFTVGFSKDKRHRTGWHIKPNFKIKLHIRDKDLLEKIKIFFKQAGNISIKDRFVYYQVCAKNEIINIIIPHFEKHPLSTHKQNDFLLFKKIMDLINNNEHLNKEGIIKIINLKANLNKGLSKKLALCFPSIPKTNIYKYTKHIDIDYNWFAGFFSGEGCFFIEVKNLRTVSLRIFVGQHIKDKLLMNSFINLLGCGSVKYSTKELAIFSINNMKDISNKIIPLFKKYKIEGTKYLDFQDFCKAAELISKKSHLTKIGLEQIILIKTKMNKNRYLI